MVDFVTLTKKYVDIGNNTFGKNLSYPTINLFSGNTKAGTWNNRTKTVSYNTEIARLNSDKFERTIAHEIAHMFVHEVFPNHKQSHGKEFRYIMNNIFKQNASTYHSYDITGMKDLSKTRKRYEVKCGCKTHMVTKKVATTGKYYCKLCNQNLQLIKMH